MILLSADIDLGQDKTRIKDPRDAERQAETARELLARLFDNSGSKRWELQLLADEVGMGKTFVALAVAYSVLEALDAETASNGLEGCYQKILIVTPPNAALFNKWGREIGEFERRCIKANASGQALERFKPILVDRLDDLVAAVRRRGGRGPRILLTTMNIFRNGKLQHYSLKRRFLLGVIFRYWGNRFNLEGRERLLKGAPFDWPKSPYGLTDVDPESASRLPFDEEEGIAALGRIDRPSRQSDLLDNFLELCRQISEPYRRNRIDEFGQIEGYLTKIYKVLCEEMLRGSFPLVIVDEAHNWKNGPSTGANGFQSFARLIASRTRRLLLLTATPFQLRPAEMLEILKLAEYLECASDAERGAERRARIIKYCRDVVRPALDDADQASRRFSKEWSRLSLATGVIEDIWQSSRLSAARDNVGSLIASWDANSNSAIKTAAKAAVENLDPDYRSFFSQALLLFALNRRLSNTLGKLIIRHRRQTDHRLVLVGNEYIDRGRAQARQDRHVLHAAPGIDVTGEAELPHYLLMRSVSAIKEGKGRSSLGSALTGCYSTLLDSAEGRSLQKQFKNFPESRVYFNALFGMVRRKDDPKHPKFAQVVDDAVHSWRNGEKTLIFCFRVNTAKRLQEVISERIRQELTQRRKNRLGGENSFRALRGRMTRREGDLIVIGLDRVLLSLAMVKMPSELRSQISLAQEDVSEIARQALRYGQDLDDDRVDRVFLHRAVEYALALRLKRQSGKDMQPILSDIASDGWIERPYGIFVAAASDEVAGDDISQVSEGGVHAHYEIKDQAPSKEAIDQLTDKLLERRARAQRTNSISILDNYFEAPNLWLGSTPSVKDAAASTLVSLHKNLWELSLASASIRDWKTRLIVMQALRRAFLRESVLLRLLPEKSDRDEKGWGALLVEHFLMPLPGQKESMAHRMEVFVEDVLGASGSVENPTSARFNLLDATRLRDQNFVALVLGGGDQKARERNFAGFNTPLLPEILVCTSVGGEGIDLHRHCRRIVHYDLAWNPAVLEQRTGRIDRIGSKAFRERDIAGSKVYLEVGVPFLAGTYDERMFDELRLRAQTFEVLTGGDVAIDGRQYKDEELTSGEEPTEGEQRNVRFKPLPSRMLEDLRAKLNVWSDPT